LLHHFCLNHTHLDLRVFRPKFEILEIVDLFLQLVHEVKPKPIHYDLGTKPIPPLLEINQKKFGSKTLVLEIGGFGFLIDFVFS
jgi:hypothetical protein